MLTRPLFGNRACSFCGERIPENKFFADHVGKVHLGVDVDVILKYLDTSDEEVFKVGTSLKHLLATSILRTL